MGHLHQCDCNTFAVESSSRIMRLLAPLMSLNTATKNQSAISLRNRGTAHRGLLVASIGLPALMNLLGRVEPDMAMRYLDVILPISNGSSSSRAQSRSIRRLSLTLQSPRFELASPAPSTCGRWCAAPCQPALPAPPSTGLQPAHKNRRGKESRAN
jgi:hypothetical protein